MIQFSTVKELRELVIDKKIPVPDISKETGIFKDILYMLAHSKGVPDTVPISEIQHLFNVVDTGLAPLKDCLNQNYITDEDLKFKPTLRAQHNITLGIAKTYLGSERKRPYFLKYEIFDEYTPEQIFELDMYCKNIPKIFNHFRLKKVLHYFFNKREEFEELIEMYRRPGFTCTLNEKERQEKNKNNIKYFNRVKKKAIGEKNLDGVVSLLYYKAIFTKDSKWMILYNSLLIEIANQKAKEFPKERDEYYKYKHQRILDNIHLEKELGYTYGYHLSDNPAMPITIYFEIPTIGQISWHTEDIDDLPIYKTPFDRQFGNLKKLLRGIRKLKPTL